MQKASNFEIDIREKLQKEFLLIDEQLISKIREFKTMRFDLNKKRLDQ